VSVESRRRKASVYSDGELLVQIAEHLATIKVILIFWTTMAVIGGLAWLIVAVQTVDDASGL
jgi:hypothetical protein